MNDEEIKKAKELSAKVAKFSKPSKGDKPLVQKTIRKDLGFVNKLSGIDVMKMKSGKDGTPGKDGSPDTPEIIAYKLNRLEDAVEAKVIKGGVPSLESMIAELKKGQYLETKNIKGLPINMNDMRWHGGGLASVTTDATLTGNGTASSPLSVVTSGFGTVTSVSVVTANGVSGSVANATTTPAITLTLGAITPTSVNSIVFSGSSTPTLAVTGTSSISGANTGDQTNISGNAATATALQNARTIGGVSFNGTANITVATATGGFTVSGGDLALGANNITITGSIGATGARVTKLWSTNIESTNAPTVSGAAVYYSGGTDVAIADGGTGASTLAGASIVTYAGTETLTNKRITKRVQSVSNAATITPNADTDDCVDVTAIAQGMTFAAPTGTPTNFQTLVIRIKDNTVARSITWNAIYVAGGVALPSITIAGKILTLGFIYNTANSLNSWQLVASAQEA